MTSLGFETDLDGRTFDDGSVESAVDQYPLFYADDLSFVSMFALNGRTNQ